MLNDNSYNNLPIYFVKNQGQTNPEVKYFSRSVNPDIFLISNGMIISLHSNRKMKRSEEKSKLKEQRESYAIKMDLENSNRLPEIEGIDRLPGKVSYFKGSDPQKWQQNIPIYSKVKYTGIYPGIDMVFYGKQKELEYDFILSPGASCENITMAFEGIDKADLDEDGNALLHFGEEEISLHYPKAYQDIDDKRQEVLCRYKIKDECKVQFEVGSYERNAPLIIDPELSYSTYLGGSDFDFGNGIAIDEDDNAYITGTTNSLNFPTTIGAYQTENAGENDVFITKLNSLGNALIYSTYLGGSLNDEGNGIYVDMEGNAYVTGRTNSTDFPTTEGAYQRENSGGYDAFAVELGPLGGDLVFSTYLGGFFEDQGNSIQVDYFGNVCITGGTRSDDFPVTEDAYQRENAGGADAFVTKLTPGGSSLFYSTYLGGRYDDEGSSIAVDDSGYAFITGNTLSDNFPTTLGAYQEDYSGGLDAFVTKLYPGGNVLAYSTYLGGSGNDAGNGIDIDDEENAYITGYTSSTNFPVTEEAYQKENAGELDCFVTKINYDGNDLIYSTYLGGSGNDISNSIVVDSSGHAYITGRTYSYDFPTTPDAFTRGLNWDIFVTKFSPGGGSLIYSTYLGGESDDFGNCIAIDLSRNIYITGRTGSLSFPTTPGAYQTSRAGGIDAFVTKINLFGETADLAVSKTDFPDPVVAGNELTYFLTVTNNGPDNATGVILTDTLPTSVVFVSSTPSQGSCGVVDNIVTCELGAIAAHETATVRIVVIPNLGGIISNTATVRGDQADPNPDNNKITIETNVLSPIPREADLAVRKIGVPNPVILGKNLIYAVTVMNNGPDRATGVILTDTLPEEVTFVSLTSSQGSFQVVGKEVICQLGTLNVNGKATVFINVITNESGTILNQARVEGNEADPNPDDNHVTIETTVVDYGVIAYNANSISDTVSAIDCGTNTVIGSPIPVGSAPYDVAVTPDGSFAYVVNYESNNVSVINTNNNAAADSPINVGNGPYSIAITPDGDFAYVTNFISNNIYVIDTNTNTVTSEPIPVSSGPLGIAITPDGNFAYVTSYYSGSVYVVDTETNTVTDGPIPVGNGPYDIAITPDGSFAYVTNLISNTVSVINLSTNTVVNGSIPVGNGPFGIAITPDGNFVYVACYYSDHVSVIDKNTNTVSKTIPVTGPLYVAITPDGNTAYVTNFAASSVTAINISTNEVTNPPIPVGVQPRGIAIARILVSGLYEADLSITKTASPNPVKAGEHLIYTLTIKNNGPDDATNVVLIDTLQSDVAFVSAVSSEGSCIESEGLIRCNLGTIENGGIRTVAITVIPEVPGTITNMAVVDAMEDDPDPNNNTVSTSVIVISPIRTADLCVSKLDTPDPAKPGEDIIYSITVLNRGPDIATDVVLNDILPEEVDLKEIKVSQGSYIVSDHRITFQLGSIENSKGAEITITVTTATTGAFINRAIVSAYETDPDLLNNTAFQCTMVLNTVF